jgi:hypothetical protein
MAGLLWPFPQIALLVARSHERSQFAIENAAPLWSSHIHVGSKRAMYLQLSMRSAPTLGARRAAGASARASCLEVHRSAAHERCRSLDAHRRQ